MELSEIPSVTNPCRKPKRVHLLGTAQIDPVVTRIEPCFHESVDAASAAEMMPRGHCPELIATDSLIWRGNLDRFGRNHIGCHDNALTRANRTVATHSIDDWRALEGEFDCTAVATALVAFHRNPTSSMVDDAHDRPAIMFTFASKTQSASSNVPPSRDCPASYVRPVRVLSRRSRRV